MIPYRWIAGALAVLVLLTAVWWHGNRAGARGEQVKGQADALAAADQGREDARMQRQASAGYQAQLQTIQGRSGALQGKLHDALNQLLPACPATVGAVVVPAVAINSLRAVGADPSP